MSEIDRTLPNTDSGSGTSPSCESKEGESSDTDTGDLRLLLSVSYRNFDRV